MPRLFVAVWPPDDVLDRLAALDRPPLDGLRWTTPDQWHVTLRFLGQVPDGEAVERALSMLSRSPTVDATLGPATGRFGRRILHVPVAGLEPVAADVLAATAHLGRPPENRPFAGHVTLARVAKDAKPDLRSLTGVGVTGGWRVEEVCLVESRLSPKGARYEVLQRFALDPSQAFTSDGGSGV